MMIDVVSKDVRAAEKQQAEQIDPGSAKQVEGLEAAGTQLLEMIAQLEQETQQHRGIETEASDEYPIQAAGAMSKKWKDTEVSKQGQLGKFGQDVMLLEHSNGIAGVADGMSSGRQSFEIANRSLHQAESILQTADEDMANSVEELCWFIEGDLSDILADLNTMEQFAIGGSTILAARYFPKFDAVVLIDLGDCEGVLTTSQDSVTVKRPNDPTVSLPHINKKQGGQASFDQFGGSKMVYAVSLSGFRQRHPGEPISLLLSTDGLKNNTGKSLEEHANDIMERGVQAVVAEAGSAADDITVLAMDLSLPAVAQQQAAG